MSPLAKFLLVNGVGGFILGIMAGVGFIIFYADPTLFSGEPLGTAMLLWAFGITFAMGAISTALALLPCR